jgi:hypothetical protein
MIHFILRLTPICVVIWALAVWLVPLPAREQPDCVLPCWVDHIQVGQTEIAQAKIKFPDTLPPGTTVIDSGAQVTLQFSNGNRPSQATVSSRGGIVSDIYINTRQPLGELVQAFGTPTCIQTATYSRFPTLVIFWEQTRPAIQAILQVDQASGLSPETLITSLSLSSASQNCESMVARPWLGFASWSRYFS